jgi:hypothetical protein
MAFPLQHRLLRPDNSIGTDSGVLHQPELYVLLYSYQSLLLGVTIVMLITTTGIAFLIASRTAMPRCIVPLTQTFPSCSLQSKRFSIPYSSAVGHTINAADLSIASDAYCTPNLLSHRANTPQEVLHLPPIATSL